MKHLIKTFIKDNWLIILSSILFMIGFVTLIILEFASGWSKEKTIGVVYSITSVSIGIVVGSFWKDYVVSHNKDIRLARNKVFMLMEEADKRNELKKIETTFINDEKDSLLEKINNILMSLKIVDKPLNTEEIYNLFSYDNPKSIYLYKINVFLKIRLKSLYNNLALNSSKKYNFLYASYKSLELVKTSSTNFFTVTLSFIFSLVALFAVIYQALSTDESLKQPLIDYLWVFFTFFIFSSSLSIIYTDAFKKEEVKKQKDNIIIIEKAINIEANDQTKNSEY